MPLSFIVLIIWAVILLAAIPYVLKTKHSNAKPIAAYLIFLTVFSAVTFGLFFLLWWLAGIVSLQEEASGPGGAAVLLALSILPALFLARWQVRKPPRKPPPI